MQIGIISDIHSNLPALENVLNSMSDVDKIICAGDIVGYNPWPAECLERVRNVCAITVKGNHDRLVETPDEYRGNKSAHAGLELAKNRLTDDQLQWLRDLPEQTTFDNGSYKLAHSHPDPSHRDAYVLPKEFPEMCPYLDDYDGLVLGHTHFQHQAVIDNKLIVNPGSVGQPRDRDPDAAFAVLNTNTCSVELRRVGYDIQRVIDKIESLGLPEWTGKRLLEGS